MDRKKFIGTVLPLGISATGLTGRNVFEIGRAGEPGILVPPYLKPGDSIGVTCPGGYISSEDIQPAVNKFIEWGFRVKIGDTVGKRDSGFGGTDQQRLEDLQKMLDDRQINAIMSARGGYGSVRIIDKLDFNKFSRHPKWIIGFSDITVLHSHINRNLGIATIHSKMCNSFPSDWAAADPAQIESIETIRKCLAGEKMTYQAAFNKNNRSGMAIGPLVGGNLKTLESLAGSASDINTQNKILFVEDTGEYLYSIDRMFWNLERSGKLSRLKGLIIGGIKAKPDDPGEEFGKTIEEIVLEKTASFDYPVCFDFPVGHQKYNVALKCGFLHKLQVDETGVHLNEA